MSQTPSFNTIVRKREKWQATRPASVGTGNISSEDLCRISAWNRTEKRYPRCSGLHELFELNARKTPQSVAVEFPRLGKTESLTYAQLNERANQLARHLQKLGVGPDVIVGVCAERSIEMALAVLGIIKAGGAYAAFDPNYPKDRLAYMLEDTKAPIVLTQQKLVSILPENGAKRICLDTDWNKIAGEKTDNLPCSVTPDHLAYLIYTSGSTGKPKGVAMRQGPLINLLQWQNENFSASPASRTLQFASLNFDVSFQELFSTWFGGGTLVLISEEERRDPTALVNFLERNRVERIFLPFVALKHLADAAERENIWPSSLKEVITAGEQLQITPQVENFFTKLPHCTLENQYGPSEAHVVTAYRLRGEPRTWPRLPSIGRPIANTQIHILNERKEPVAVGDIGELYIGGVCLARGYLNRPDLTDEKFIPDPFSRDENARLYKSGDLARFQPDGNIEFLGRIDHQVKIRGYRIELGEVEAVLSQHPSVRETVAIARDTANGDKQLVAYVVSKNGGPKSSELRDFLQQRLPPQAIPSAFVVLPKLPLTPNGKVDRRALPAPAEVETDTSESAKEPSDALELQLRIAFEKFFQRRPIGVDMSFFELGGDSLQALKLIVEVDRITGKKLPLNVLYEAATVEKLAKFIREQNGPAEFSSLVPLHPRGKRPPVFWVHTTPGDVLSYGNLTFHLSGDQPSYAFQSMGLHRAELCPNRLEEMAAQYVKLMRSVQPKGPYFLGGWCYGGLVAVEMAHQLLAAGQKVAPLLLIETPALAPSFADYRYYLRRFRCLFGMTPKQVSLYAREKIKYYRGIKTEDEKRFRRVSEEDGFTREQAEERNRFLAQLEQVYQTNLNALNAYRPKFYPGKIILLNAAEPDPAVVRDPLYGWPGLAADIEAHVIPGNHDTILMEPHVQVLAEKITECLDESQRQV